MERIDAHQHFWRYDPVKDSWITEEMEQLRRDFVASDLHPLLLGNAVTGCVAVQANQSEEETMFLISLAEQNNFIKGVVGWVDLQSNQLRDRLAYFKQYEIIKGFRHILQSERDRKLMLKPAFMRGIEALQEYGFTYDILIYSDQLVYIEELAGAFPGQKFVIDHLAKPGIKSKQIDEWKNGINKLSRFKNIYCKISGMVTEADWKNWQLADFTDCLDVVTNVFGTDRLMYGSDWPVCLVAALYKQTLDIVEDYFSSFPESEQDKILGLNAIEFYNLRLK